MKITALLAALVLTSSGNAGDLGGGQGSTFKDCADCPEMVVVPAGKALIGARAYDKYAKENEKPARKIHLSEDFAVSRFEITYGQFRACVDAHGCANLPRHEFWQTEDMPVVWVSWHQAVEYASWLSSHSGMQYRLLTEAEWEYSARANQETIFWWGDELGVGNANCLGCDGPKYTPIVNRRLRVIGSYEANPFGLHDMLGNATEWVLDCYTPTLMNLPSDGAPNAIHECEKHVAKGGNYLSQGYQYVRISSRFGVGPEFTQKVNGFRVRRGL